MKTILATILIALTVFVSIRFNIYFQGYVAKYAMSEQIEALDKRISKLESMVKPEATP